MMTFRPERQVWPLHPVRKLIVSTLRRLFSASDSRYFAYCASGGELDRDPWFKRAYLLGAHVRVVDGDQAIEGTHLGIDAEWGACCFEPKKESARSSLAILPVGRSGPTSRDASDGFRRLTIVRGAAMVASAENPHPDSVA